MSAVTDAVVVLSWVDDWDGLAAILVGPIAGIDGPTQRFRQLADIEVQAAAGGPKAMTSHIFLAGFNNIETARLVAWFEQLPWLPHLDNACLSFDTEGRLGMVAVIAGTTQRIGAAIAPQ
jgi:hypothetical protein